MAQMIYAVNENSKHMAHETEDLFQRLLHFFLSCLSIKGIGDETALITFTYKCLPLVFCYKFEKERMKLRKKYPVSQTTEN